MLVLNVGIKCGVCAVLLSAVRVSADEFTFRLLIIEFYLGHK